MEKSKIIKTAKNVLKKSILPLTILGFFYDYYNDDLKTAVYA